MSLEEDPDGLPILTPTVLLLLAELTRGTVYTCIVVMEGEDVGPDPWVCVTDEVNGDGDDDDVDDIGEDDINTGNVGG